MSNIGNLISRLNNLERRITEIENPPPSNIGPESLMVMSNMKLSAVPMAKALEVLNSGGRPDTIPGNPNAGLSYNAYAALLSQTGTTAPVAVLLDNSLKKNPTWVYEAVGRYILTAVSVFPVGRTAIIPVSNMISTKVTGAWLDSSTIEIVATDLTTGLPANDHLSNTFVEVRVYSQSLVELLKTLKDEIIQGQGGQVQIQKPKVNKPSL